MKKTKIICSIGPSSRNYNTMKQMIEHGMNVARINFSHADETEKRETLELVHQLNQDTGSHVAILFDTKGPDFRTGTVLNDEIELVEGETIKIVKDDIVGTKDAITVNYKEELDYVKVNDTILLEDGLMRLSVIDKNEKELVCKIVCGGLLGNRKGVNVPGKTLHQEFLSDQDQEDIRYACTHQGDYLGLSFVSSKEDVLSARRLLKKYNCETMQIISKVESEIAIKNIDDIIEVSDGIMIARGDLGVELPLQQIPIIQKEIIKKCRAQGKVCIVATEMLASMCQKARPTRAEVTDIANAVLDGTDAVMLSGETTIGKYPVEAVKYMSDICLQAEAYIDYNKQIIKTVHPDITGAIATSVTDSANMLGAKLLVTTTMTGYTARKISNLRPQSLILATCASEKVALSLALNWSVYPTVLPIYNSTDEIVKNAVSKAKEFVDLKTGDIVIITGGFPNTQTEKVTNFMKIQII